MVVVISYKDLASPDADLFKQVAEGFGNDPDCLGIIVVKDLPGFVEKREKLLRMASVFAALPDTVKESCVHNDSTFLFGWSHGKEKIEGSLDFAKGSYYNNPVHDKSASKDPEYHNKFPAYGYDNVWPKELPDLKDAYMDLGSYIVNVGTKLAHHCDKYIVSKDPSISPHFIESAIESSITHKARLLHYFPIAEKHTDASKIGGWCGLHIDHSMITGLTSAMYVKDDDPEYKEIVISSLPENERGDLEGSGLYIKSRGGEYIKVNIPRDCLAFQIGEASQVASNGLLVATPHLVKSGGAANVSRNTFAVFMQPNVDHQLTSAMTFDQLTQEVMKRHY
ncbi:hypothetical protein HDU97_007926 [Phlyctochytrium planicorne]|nr:hypothetical protein HDU97_007926 [Phlyctochytrium planicorne]